MTLRSIWNDLLKLKGLDAGRWSQENETQLQDEIRHASLILNELKKNNAPIVKDLKFSMQEKLYRPFVDLAKSESFAEVLTVHNMTEHRAVWIYKTYARLGHNKSYRELALKIKNEEAAHFKITTNDTQNNLIGGILDQSLRSVDLFIFNHYLPARYGPLLFRSEKFWNDYYREAVVESNEDHLTQNVES